MNIDREKILKLADDLRFDLNEEELLYAQEEFVLFGDMLKIFEKIDTEDTEEMVYPIEEKTFFLREDKEEKTHSREEILSNAPEVRDGMIRLPRVVTK